MGADVKLQAALENALTALKYTPDTAVRGDVTVALPSAPDGATSRKAAETRRPGVRRAKRPTQK